MDKKKSQWIERLEETEGRINEMEDRNIKITQSEGQ